MKLISGDCVEQMALLEANSVDAVVTDPPYGLGFMGKEWDTHEKFVDFSGSWAEQAFRVLADGCFLLSFGGTRTYHQMVTGVEAAGFEIKDTLSWIYGTGFPKGGWLKPAQELIVLARKPGKKPRKLDVASTRIGDERVGRYPANIVFDEEAGALLDAQSGIRPGGSYPAQRSVAQVTNFGVGKPTPGGARSMGDSGGASRFFYCAKASKSEREAGLEALPDKVIQIQQPHNSKDLEARYQMTRKNNHPTVKPVALMEWLVRLVSQEGDTVLDPFMGSGSTGIACRNTGRSFIGIEKDADYLTIAQVRIGEIE